MSTAHAPADTLSSDEAAEWLGIKRETLYAYVSRGLVKGLPGARGLGRRYRREDLEPLRARSAGPAASALRFGEPVLDTRLTRITAEGPQYRSHAAVALVGGSAPFEAVAELLWTGVLPGARPAWRAHRPGAPTLDAPALARWLPPGSPPLAALALVLPVLAAADPLRFDSSADAVIVRARWLLPQLAASFALALDPRRLPAALGAGGDVVQVLAQALGVGQGAAAARGRRAARGAGRGAGQKIPPRALDLLRAALILCADHELNASTFAARVAASTGADLYACLGAAVAAFSGPRHGGASEQVEMLVQEAGTPERAAAAIGNRLRRGERLPGFGHPLYAQGDPRVPPLLERALALAPRAPRLRTLLALSDAVVATGRPPPNLDVGLAAACAALDLPPGMGPAIFAAGRIAGWVAHVLEQQQSNSVLRPRARFVGAEPPVPESAALPVSAPARPRAVGTAAGRRAGSTAA